MKIGGFLVAIFAIVAAIFHPGSAADSAEKVTQPKLPNVGDYWVVNPDACFLSWESQIWGSRAFDEIRRNSGRTTVLVCVNGADSPEKWVADWAKAQLGDTLSTVWVIRPDQPPETRLFAWSSDIQVPDHEAASEMAAEGKYLSALEEIVKVSQ
jgi:hypothetical protein